VPGPHDAREALGPTVGVGHAPAPRQTAELGIGGTNADVAPRRQFATAGETVPIEGGDRRLARIQAGEAHRSGLVEVVVLEQAHPILEVRAGTEREIARARHHEDAHAFILRKRVDRATEADGGVPVDAVALFGAVDAQDADRAAVFGGDLVWHG